MNKRLLRARIRSLLLKEAQAYQAYYDLANGLAAASDGKLHANQSQGKIKGREPHVRLMLTDIGQSALSATMEKIKAAGGYSKLFSDSTLASEFGSAVLHSLPGGAKYIGPSSKILSKSFPGFDIEYEGQVMPVVITIPGARVQKGAAYQNVTTELIAQELTSLGHNVGASKTAAKGSQAPDVSLEYDGKTINAEVKGPGGKYFDKTVQRGKTDASAEVTLINDIAAAMSAAKGIPSQDLESYIDNIQKQQLDSGMESSTAGYIGDEKLRLKRSGEPLASGALPTEYFQIQPTNEIIDAIKNHWASGGDSYFVVSDGTTSHIWHTGFGDNPLNAPIFDIGSITGQVKLSTYGSAGTGRLRVALSSKFSLESALRLPKTVTESRTIHPGLLGRSPNINAETSLEAKLLRCLIQETLLYEELTKSDKKEIERIAKKQAKTHVAAELDKALGKNFLGSKGKVNKFVEDEISKRFKSGDKDKDFSDAVERVSKRVLQALFSLHYKRNNLIKSMPVSKS